MSYSHKSHTRGFTLLELIIVIAILAILSVAVVLVINPAETLRRARDSQRLSDAAAIKSAIGLYLSDVSTGVTLGGSCFDDGTSTGKIYYSYPNTSPGAQITDTTAPTGSLGSDTTGTISGTTGCGGASPWCIQVSAANLGSVNGSGWIPVNLSAISSGSPLASYPVDPTNTMTAAELASVTNASPIYRYGCKNVTTSSTRPALVYELDQILESTQYSGLMSTDGGDNPSYYETGTSLRLLPTSATF
jgi:prepilin-type N-terminal cleavage/methylation domain-containing protein